MLVQSPRVLTNVSGSSGFIRQVVIPPDPHPNTLPEGEGKEGSIKISVTIHEAAVMVSELRQYPQRWPERVRVALILCK